MIDVVFSLPDTAVTVSYYLLGTMVFGAFVSVALWQLHKTAFALLAAFALGLWISNSVLNTSPSKVQAEWIASQYSIIGEEQKAQQILSAYESKTIWKHSRDFRATVQGGRLSKTRVD